jgi:diguanylate cyclase (GGDEF)-like protein
MRVRSAPVRTGTPTSHWRPGIALQLACTFVAIGALVLTANFAAQRTISITTTRVRTVAPPPSANPLTPPGAGAPEAIMTTLAVDSAIDRAARDFQRSSERFEAGVAARLDSDTPDRGREFDTASAELRRSGSAGAGLNVKQLLAASRELIALADRRRAAFGEYTAAIETMNARMQRSVDGAWKIMGRVVARQSLMTASQRLADIRRNAAAFGRADGYDADLRQQMGDDEAVFLAVLTREQDSLRKSQGKEWLALMQQEATRAVTLRGDLTQLDSELRDGRAQFIADASAVRAQVSAAAAKTASRLQRRAARSQPRPAPAVAVVPAPVVAPTPAADESISTSVDPGDRAAARRFAWLSAAALLLVLAVSVATALSIVAPVKRLIRASRRVASGDVAARVPRGGNRELDGLAVAFNEMAERLAQAHSAAQGYQQRLESDVVERTRQLQHLAEHDPLTSLPNRRQLFSHLQAALADATLQGEHVGLFFLDLDNFKNINDGMGHALGDRLLYAIAERLKQTIGPQGFAARLGGDEFTVVHAGGRTLEDMAQAGWNIVRAFQEPLRIDGRDLLVSISVGAGFFPDHAQDAESLLRAADAALFRAKALGRSQLTVFTPDLLEAAASKFSTEQGLRLAVERGELELVYQPEVNLHTLETTVVEALLRWHTSDGRRLAPADFLAVAEESGLIIEINDWVLRTGIAAASRWHHNGWPTVRVAINVSARQLFDVQFADRVQALLHEHQLPPQCLEIELTETVLQTGASTIEGLKRLHAMGVSVALDDFGTGYSTLASLEHLPLTRVKLDRSLIAGIDVSVRSAAIATAIIGLCQDLGVQITAEGVERPAQLTALRNSPVNLQGYLISRPVAEADVLATVASLPAKLQGLLLEAPAGNATDMTGGRTEAPASSDTQRRRALRVGLQV